MSHPAPHFSPSRKGAGLLFVSGQLPFDANRNLVPGGIREQTKQCLANIAAILAKEGMTLEQVVKCTVWITRTENFAEFNKTYAEVFTGTPPARSTVRSDLVVDALIEIEAVASRGE